MKYFIDIEFLEGSQIERNFFGQKIGETKPTIDLISIGIVAEDGMEYYAISKDFNLKEAWNRHDIVKGDCTMVGSIGDDQYEVKNYWIRDNVLKPIFDEWVTDDSHWTNKDRTHGRWEFTYENFKWHLAINGKSNNQIADEIRTFVYRTGTQGYWSINDFKSDGKSLEFYGYYCDYDWVVFCWLFGRMIDLPNGFPMYCRDLKQLLDEKIRGGIKLKIRSSTDCFTDRAYSIGDIYNTSFKDMIKYIKDHPGYPKQTNEHNALADAKWNLELYKFLSKL